MIVSRLQVEVERKNKRPIFCSIASSLFSYLRNVGNGVVVTEKTVVILFPEFTEPGIGVNRPDIVVFKNLGGKETLGFEELDL
jgi:hypothetical protein